MLVSSTDSVARVEVRALPRGRRSARAIAGIELKQGKCGRHSDVLVMVSDEVGLLFKT